MFLEKSNAYAHKSEPPEVRRLQAYAFDPSMSVRLDTAPINHLTIKINWEDLSPGPVGEYVEVLDFDPASGCWYEPVDLNSTFTLAQDGISPSLGNPKFHQQMVYTVAMYTIANFEQALGRQIQWSPRIHNDQVIAHPQEIISGEEFVGKLRLYPHALRAANAYYSPQKKAVLFGYFEGPAGTVFSCLSQDIIAHEVTHALLDGLHRRYVEDNHIDTLAFHEGFADLVALFQHFTFSEVLEHQIERTRGDLEAPSLLGELAQEFGQATGRYGALRSAIGRVDEDGKWRLVQPDPEQLKTLKEPHARGAILVAAVFSAFLAIYKSRARPLLALATAGSGVLPDGLLHPTLVQALAAEATKTAKHFLQMCIRSLDYCPPIDISFGDYLRALITSDYDMVPIDTHGYRVALIESFRKWGIVPDGVRTISEEQLRWGFAKNTYQDLNVDRWTVLSELAEHLSPLVNKMLYRIPRIEQFNMLKEARVRAHEFLQKVLVNDQDEGRRKSFMEITGLDVRPNMNVPGLKYKSNTLPSFEVHAVIPTLRVTPDGKIMKQLIITVTQRIRGIPIDSTKLVDATDKTTERFDFRGGSTLIFDMEKSVPKLRYAITRNIQDTERLEKVRAHRAERSGEELSMRSVYFSGQQGSQRLEPFCILHGEH
jgi:hypothetical protein